MPQLRQCPQCRALLPTDEFRRLRYVRQKRRAKICELCEVENRHRAIRRRRQRLREEEARRMAAVRNVTGDFEKEEQ